MSNRRYLHGILAGRHRSGPRRASILAALFTMLMTFVVIDAVVEPEAAFATCLGTDVADDPSQHGETETDADGDGDGDECLRTGERDRMNDAVGVISSAWADSAARNTDGYRVRVFRPPIAIAG